MKRGIFSLLLVLGMAVPAFAQMMGMPMMEHGGGHGPMMEMGSIDKMDEMIGMCLKHAEEIGLSDAQLAKIKPLHTEMRKKQARFRSDLKIAEIEFMEIMDVKDFDLEKATAAMDKITEIKKAHHVEMLTAMKEIRAVFTDEQFKKMRKIMMSMPAEKKATKGMMKKNP